MLPMLSFIFNSLRKKRVLFARYFYPYYEFSIVNLSSNLKHKKTLFKTDLEHQTNLDIYYDTIFIIESSIKNDQI